MRYFIALLMVLTSVSYSAPQVQAQDTQSLFGEFFFNAANGIQSIGENATGSEPGQFGPDFVINALLNGGAIPNFPQAIANLRDQAQQLADRFPSSTNAPALAGTVILLNQLEASLEQATTAATASGVFSQASIGALNSTLMNILNGFPDSVNFGNAEQVAREVQVAARAAINTLADTDPFVILQGVVTNDSSTEVLDFSIGFEEALFAALDPNDVSLSRQILLDVQLSDTNGDGIASARSASFGFSAFGTNEPNAPSLSNTQPLGTNETVFDFISDADGDGLEEGLRLIEGTEPVDLSQLLFLPEDFVDPDNTLVSHLLGTLDIQDISPGDTVLFTAILSVGDPTDPNLPLLDVEQLEAILTAGSLVGVRLCPAGTKHAGLAEPRVHRITATSSLFFFQATTNSHAN